MIDRARRRLLKAALAAAGGSLLQWRWAAAQTTLLRAPRRALVIGNSSYSFGPLKNPANDARAIAEELKRTGFEVASATDLSREQMMNAISAYGEGLTRSKAVGVFYFAGHGVQLAWRNYLLPTDALVSRMEDVQASCVDVNAVIESITRAANPMNVIILDACRENPFGRDFRVEQKGLSQLDAPPGTLLAFATSPGNVASDGEGSNGLYTENLLREIKVPEAKIEDVFKRVRLAVRRRSRGQQIPWESTSLEEDFYFLPPRELKELAEQEREREFREQQALWEKVQAAERQRQAEAERERLRKEEAARQEQARLAEQRRREEAERERMKQEELALQRKLRDAEQQRADAERARLLKEEAALQERQKAAELKRLQDAERERQAKAEAARIERQKAASTVLPVEDYLRQYPSGYFSELAQLQLDRVLEREGENKIEIIASPQNPYSKGFATTDTQYRIGDSYTYHSSDLYSRVVARTVRQTITKITDTEVIYNDGRLVTDLLGNILKSPDGRSFSANQRTPGEFVVGKRWSTRFVTTVPERGESQTEISFRITGTERITVAAGTFDTFVVVGHGWSSGAGPMLQVGSKAWFAPGKVRRPVAIESLRKNRQRTLQAERLELVSYQQS
jgi:uncharacterized caspase-like protein